MSFLVSGPNGVIDMNETTTIDPLDYGIVIDSPHGAVQLVAIDPDLLFRLAACAMVAADTLMTKLGASDASTGAVLAPR